MPPLGKMGKGAKGAADAECAQLVKELLAVHTPHHGGDH